MDIRQGQSPTTTTTMTLISRRFRSETIAISKSWSNAQMMADEAVPHRPSTLESRIEDNRSLSHSRGYSSKRDYWPWSCDTNCRLGQSASMQVGTGTHSASRRDTAKHSW